jgi:hypothetical protein
MVTTISEKSSTVAVLSEVGVPAQTHGRHFLTSRRTQTAATSSVDSSMVPVLFDAGAQRVGDNDFGEIVDSRRPLRGRRPGADSRSPLSHKPASLKPQQRLRQIRRWSSYCPTTVPRGVGTTISEKSSTVEHSAGKTLPAVQKTTILNKCPA